MKKLLVSATALCFAVSAWATVDVSVTTHTYGGEYAPENCCAIWVEKDDGTFVKTIAAWGGDLYKWYLIKWIGKAPAADYETDAMTGASRSTHGTINKVWNLTNTAGTAVPHGTYKIIIEMTEINNQGPLDTLGFTYDGTSITATKPDKAPFSGFSAAYAPAGITSPLTLSENMQLSFGVFPTITSAGSSVRLSNTDAASAIIKPIDGNNGINIPIVSNAVLLPGNLTPGMYTINAGTGIARIVITEQEKR